jgi:phosphatidylserine/phosphatidylglycerophosphate/cardiolipin synthase-like enzyme
MDPRAIDELLARTLEDRRLSRAERRDLADRLRGPGADEAHLASCRARAFAAARAALRDPADGDLLDWLEDVLKALQPPTGVDPAAPASEAFFSPGDDCARQIIGLLARARRAVDICVFTITDDRISGAILDAHRRGVALRIISDNMKEDDEGSDLSRFRAAGIPLRVDRTVFHMHHKFAIFDGALLLTGSYNWTRGAARDNEENFITTPDRRLIASFTAAFGRLWDSLA